MKAVHADKKFKCDLCTFETADNYTIKRHYSITHYKVKHPCDECEYEATDIGMLRFHKKSQHLGIRKADIRLIYYMSKK